jgi:selenocysteine-specific elongation factor
MEPLHVVATAGHVDHGKSSLIQRLTGTHPDRWEEERRRGLTIDLGYAWCRLPSGREIAFVDVPGHERFIGNMLAGVGPLRRVVFVVAADEGWKPQSEEHLAILDALGASGVVALTKVDLVDAGRLRARVDEVASRLVGTALGGAPIVPTSARTGAGYPHLLEALDALTAIAVDAGPDARPRLFVDRVFSVRGAGTVVTGTLVDGCLEAGMGIVVLPSGLRARIRGIQSHGREAERACSVTRVALNLVGLERREVHRGDVVARPDEWRPRTEFDARIRPVRGLDRRLTSRGSFIAHVGAAQVEARIRLLGATVAGDDGAFARVRVAHPLVLDIDDALVLRDSGRAETVAGGRVIDPDPARRPGRDAAARLEARSRADRVELPAIIARERGAVRVRDVRRATGVIAEGSPPGSEWIIDARLRDRVRDVVAELLRAEHATHPLRGGVEQSAVRREIVGALARAGTATDDALIDALVAGLVSSGGVVRSGSTLRLADHAGLPAADDERIERVLDAVRVGEPTPPSIPSLVAAGVSTDAIDAAVRTGALVRISDDLVVRAEFVATAHAALTDLAGAARPITVSAFRERMGTTRKYAVPLLEYFDRSGITRRVGDVRELTAAGARGVE